jgi:hypothetical protein
MLRGNVYVRVVDHRKVKIGIAQSGLSSMDESACNALVYQIEFPRLGLDRFVQNSSRES